MKTLITGPGRAGTSFLVQVLTELGFNTGYDKAQCEKELGESRGHCGLEAGNPDAHEIIKSINMGYNPMETLRRVIPDLVIIPIRDPWESACSRESCGDQNGGFDLGKKTRQQHMEASAIKLHDLIYVLTDMGVSYVFFPYPKWILYPETCYPYMKLLLDEKGLTMMDWVSAVVRLRNTEWIHTYHD